MSDALAVFHGDFGRVCLYALDRSMVPHAHREGHLILHVDGPPAEIVVDQQRFPVSPGQGVAVNPWQPHYYRQLLPGTPTLCLVAYIRPSWFLEAAQRATVTLSFGRNGLEVTDPIARLVYGTAQTMLEADAEGENAALCQRLCDLTRSAFDQSWQWTKGGANFIGPSLPRRDFRIRNALQILRERLGTQVELDQVARDVGLSRPHFFKLFRAQVGVTPNLYVNALRMERAIDLLADTRDAVADIGFDLGFSSQASFSRFFIANGVVPPSTYRRSVLAVA